MDIRVRGYHLTGDENKVKVEVGTAEKKEMGKSPDHRISSIFCKNENRAWLCCNCSVSGF